MASNRTLPNPYTPMAYIPPALARKMTIDIYATIGSLSVLLWDIILHLPQDYELLVKYRINPGFILYFTSRITSLMFLIGTVVVQTAPIGNCSAAVSAVHWIYPFTIPLTTMILVLRVSALYKNNKYVVSLVSVSWISVVATSIYMAYGTGGKELGNTKYCSIVKSVKTRAMSALNPFFHDTLVFFLTSWVFVKSSYADVTLKGTVKSFLSGDRLPAFSKTILRDGQAYFLATLIVNVIFITLFYVHGGGLSPCTLAPPTFVLINTMTSHIYRNMRLAYYRDTTVATSAINNAVPTGPQDGSRMFGIVFRPMTSTQGQVEPKVATRISAEEC